MKKETQDQLEEPSIDNLGLVVAQHYYGIGVRKVFRQPPPLPYDEDRDRWTLQPRRPANSMVRLKKSEINLQPRRSFWGKLFGREA